MISPSVLIAPAMAIGSAYYQPLIAEFERHGWAARALSRRGFEKDESPAGRHHDWSYSDEVADIAIAVAKARVDEPNRPVLLLGHSLGGQLAIHHQTQFEPVDALITVGTSSPHFRLQPWGGLHVLALASLGPLFVWLRGFWPQPLFGAPGAATLMREWARFARSGRAPFTLDRPLEVPTLAIELEGDFYAGGPAHRTFHDRHIAPEYLTSWFLTKSEAKAANSSIDHIAWVRSPKPVVDRILSWWASQTR